MKQRTALQLCAKLIGLVKPLSGWMLLAVTLGLAGHLCAAFITIEGAAALLNQVSGTAALGTGLFGLIAGMAFLRGILRYGEQACNHYIAFRLLALIRTRVFQALRRLAPAKLEGRENAAELKLEMLLRANEMRAKLRDISVDKIGTRRLLRAFPDMKSLTYAETLASTRAGVRRLNELAAAARTAAKEMAQTAKETAQTAVGTAAAAAQTAKETAANAAQSAAQTAKEAAASAIQTAREIGISTPQSTKPAKDEPGQ